MSSKEETTINEELREIDVEVLDGLGTNELEIIETEEDPETKRIRKGNILRFLLAPLLLTFVMFVLGFVRPDLNDEESIIQSIEQTFIMAAYFISIFIGLGFSYLVLALAFIAKEVKKVRLIQYILLGLFVVVDILLWVQTF